MREIKNNFYALKYIWNIRKSYIVITTLISTIGSMSPIINNILIKSALDVVSIPENQNNLINMLIFFGFYSLIISFISNYYNNVYSRILVEDIKEKILEDLYKKSREIEITEYDNHEFFNKYNFVLSNSTNKLLNTVNIFSNLISGIVSIGFLVVLIMTIDIRVIILSSISSVLNFYINLKVSKLGYSIEKENNPNFRKIGYVERIYYLRDYTKDLRSTNLPKVLTELYKEGKKGIVEIIKQKGKKQSFFKMIQSTIQITNMIIVIIYLSSSLKKKYITVGEFAVAYNSFGQLSSSIERIMGFFPQIYQNSFYIEDFRQFMEYETADADVEVKDRIKSFKKIELKNIDFSYQRNIQVLKDINIEIRSGEKIALVGANGAGKSTIANIIQGFYKPDNGEVLINDKCIKSYNKTDINKIIGTFPQDYKIYGLSIIENIALDKREDITEKDKIEIKKILGDLKILEKIEKLPSKLETKITFELDPDGANFSGGELQKIALARVLYKEYKIMILDEPSSALDTYSEKEIFDSILKKYSKESIVLISHRLTNVIDVDRIYYIEDGKITEEGTHVELMKQKGSYRELFELQSKNYIKK